MQEGIAGVVEWHSVLRQRRAAIWRIVEEHGCDAALIFGSQEHPEAFRYLTNYVPPLGDMWAVMSGPDKMDCILTFHWGLDVARGQSGIDTWRGDFDPLPTVLASLDGLSAQPIAVFNGGRIPSAASLRMASRFRETVLVDADESLEAVRRRKSHFEIQLLQEAARITDAAIGAVVQDLRLGTTENEVAARLGYEMRRRGADLAFRPIAVSGTQEPVIAREPTMRELRAGDTLMVDVGASFQGYQADVARTFVVGRPSALQRKAWDAVLRAFEAALEKCSPGVPCVALHRAAAEKITAAGFPVWHRMGHGVGLATSFEWPSLDTESTALEAGMTLAIEPAIYAVGVGSMKLEDMIVVTEDGYRFLSNSLRDLRSI